MSQEKPSQSEYYGVGEEALMMIGEIALLELTIVKDIAAEALEGFE